jgi:hypothetical protein
MDRDIGRPVPLGTISSEDTPLVDEVLARSVNDPQADDMVTPTAEEQAAALRREAGRLGESVSELAMGSAKFASGEVARRVGDRLETHGLSLAAGVAIAAFLFGLTR